MVQSPIGELCTNLTHIDAMTRNKAHKNAASFATAVNKSVRDSMLCTDEMWALRTEDRQLSEVALTTFNEMQMAFGSNFTEHALARTKAEAKAKEKKLAVTVRAHGTLAEWVWHSRALKRRRAAPQRRPLVACHVH